MLVLSCRERETVLISKDVKVQVLQLRDGQVRIGIEAPADVKIMCEELLLRQQRIDAKNGATA